MFNYVNNFLVTITILLSYICLINLLLRDKFYKPSLADSLLNGLLSGMFGCLLMMNGILIRANTIIDFRYISIILMALYISWLAVLETTIILATFQLIFWTGKLPSWLSVCITLIIGLICMLISLLAHDRKLKLFLLVATVSLVSGAGIYFHIHDWKDFSRIITLYLILNAGAAVLLCFLIEHLVRSNHLFEKIKEAAELDSLTGLKNRGYFDHYINTKISPMAAAGNEISLLYIDIDYFKSINDQFGHANGDRVLVALGQIIRLMARNEDVVSRKGGEEFVILLNNCKVAEAAIVAERIRKMVEEHEFILDNQTRIQITVSIGVSALSDTVREGYQLVEKADFAMYAAKRAGRNKVVVENETI